MDCEDFKEFAESTANNNCLSLIIVNTSIWVNNEEFAVVSNNGYIRSSERFGERINDYGFGFSTTFNGKFSDLGCSFFNTSQGKVGYNIITILVSLAGRTDNGVV